MSLFENVGVGYEVAVVDWINSIEDMELRENITVNEDFSIDINKLFLCEKEKKINISIPKYINIRNIFSLTAIYNFPADILSRAKFIGKLVLWNITIPKNFKIKPQVNRADFCSISTNNLIFLNQNAMYEIILKDSEVETLKGLPYDIDKLEIKQSVGKSKFTIKDIIDTGININRKINISF